MRHQYTSEEQTSGVWITDGDEPRRFCEWTWDTNAHILRVRKGVYTRPWSPHSVNPEVLACLANELPDIAKGIAEQMEREQGS